MPLVLIRIDDRLIHGQVVEGWLPTVQAARVVVASDSAAADPFQISLMRLALPREVHLTVLDVNKTATALLSDAWKKERILLLLPGLKEARRLLDAGVKWESLNLGGLHQAPGRVTLTPSLSLSSEDKADIKWILEKGVAIETRSLPGDEKKTVQRYLEGE